MGNGAETDIATLSAMVPSDGSKGQKFLRPLLVPQSGFWLPGLPFLLPCPGMAASWFAAFLPLNLMGSCFPAPPQSVPSFLTDTPESHQMLKAQGLSLPMDAAQLWKWQPFPNACLPPLERLPLSQFSMLNHTLIGPLSLATLLSQPALHSTPDRPGVFSVSLYTPCPVRAF